MSEERCPHGQRVAEWHPDVCLICLEDKKHAKTGLVLEEVHAELRRARELHPNPQNSAHEGYAVIWEEVEELWADVKKKRSPERTAAMREEAIQVAAMAVRFIEDVCDRPNRP
jgi:hypothetical protein